MIQDFSSLRPMFFLIWLTKTYQPCISSFGCHHFVYMREEKTCCVSTYLQRIVEWQDDATIGCLQLPLYMARVRRRQGQKKVRRARTLKAKEVATRGDNYRQK